MKIDDLRALEAKRLASIDFSAFPEGFTYTSRGRSGEIYFRSKERVLEVYWEMSGVDYYDILLSLEGAKQWIHPIKERVDDIERQNIIDSLEQWLKSKKIRSDAFGPIKRPLFP